MHPLNPGEGADVRKDLSEPRTAAAYARVSTGRQEQEETIDSQLEEIRAAIRDRGDVLKEDCVFLDDGWTGEILQRPGLDALRDAAAERRFEALYVYDRGRVSRVYAYQEVILEEIESKGIAFVSLHDIAASTPEEKVLQAMQGVFHQYERVKIAERFRRGKLYKAKQGVLVSGQVPYGYRRINRTADAPARALIDEERAQIVRRIREWYGLERLSIHRIIDRLYRMGIPPPRGRAEGWKRSTVRRLLESEVYHRGVVYFNKTEAVVPRNPQSRERYRKVKRTSRRVRPKEEWLPIRIPPIVPDDGLYERIQELLKLEGRSAPRHRKHPYLLNGKVHCACGNRRAGDGYGRNHYYRCVERVYKHPLKGACRLPGVNAQALDEAVWTRLASLLVSPELLKEHASRWIQEGRLKDGSRADERAEVLKEIGRVREEEERYIGAYGSGALDFERFRQAMNGVRRKRSELERQLSRLSEARRLSTGEPDTEGLCQEAIKTIRPLDLEVKRAVLQDLVEKVVIGEDRSADVWARIPLTDKVEYQNGDRDLDRVIPYLELRFQLPLPKARKARTIVSRDERGRIQRTQVP